MKFRFYLIFGIILLGTAVSLSAKKPVIENLPVVFKSSSFISYNLTHMTYPDFNNWAREHDIFSVQNSSLGTLYRAKAVMKQDSTVIRFTILKFINIYTAYEYFCRYFMPDQDVMQLGWGTVSINPSMALCWYRETLYFINQPDSLEMDQGKLINQILVQAKKIKNVPNFLKVFPENNQIPHSLRVSLTDWLQFRSLNPVFYADYENKGRFSRIFIIPQPEDSILIQFQKFRNFYFDNGLRVEEPFATDLPYFIAQDVFLGRMVGVLYRNYIIGVMNYPNVDWVKDRLNEIKASLKKYPIPVKE